MAVKTRDQQETFPGLELRQPSSAAAGHPSALYCPCPHSPCGSSAGHCCLSAQLCAVAAQRRSSSAHTAGAVACCLLPALACSHGWHLLCLWWAFLQLPKASGKTASLSPWIIFSAGQQWQGEHCHCLAASPTEPTCIHSGQGCPKPRFQLFDMAEGAREKELGTGTVFRDKLSKWHFAFH